MYRHLRILGFDEHEAGNLTAFANGIAICPQPWTVRELTHLLFLREMNGAGHRWSNPEDRATNSRRAASALGRSSGRTFGTLAPPTAP